MTAEKATMAQLMEARKEAVAGLLIAAMGRDHTAQSCALEALINLGQVNLIAASPLLINIAVYGSCSCTEYRNLSRDERAVKALSQLRRSLEVGEGAGCGGCLSSHFQM